MVKRLFRNKLLLVFIALVGVLAVQTIASAAPVPSTLYLRLWPEAQTGQAAFLEAVEYPATTPLPIEVKMAIPKGATITWAGELLSGAPGSDIQAQPVVTPKDGYDEVSFMLTKSHIAQVETDWPVLQLNGDNRSLTLPWTQRFPANQTIFEVREPSQASNIQMTPPATSSNTAPDGTRFHSTSPLQLAVGQTQTFNLTYTRPVKGPSTMGQTAQTGTEDEHNHDEEGQQVTGQVSTGTSFLVILIAVAVVAVVFAAKRRRV